MEKLEKGKVYISKVIDFSHDGGAVVKLDDYVVFLDKGVINDLVEFEVTKVKKSFAQGKLLQIIEKSPDRVEYSNINESLGGIPLINYDYEKQLDWKKEKVRIDLEKETKLKDININDTLEMEDPFYYRNHVQIPVTNYNDRNYIGFYEKNSQRVFEMDESILMTDNANKAFRIVKSWIKDNDLKGFNRRESKGIIRHIGIRTNYKDEVMLIIVTNSKKVHALDDLVNRCKDEGVVSIYHNINKSKSSRVYGNEYIKVYGEDYLVDRISDFEFLISPNSFFQVNRVQTEKMYSKVIDYLNLNDEDVVYDLFSGIGTISMLIAKEAKMVFGIESVEEAVTDANKNAKNNHIENIEFLNDRVEEILPKLAKEGKRANKIVLDPPRTGCEDGVIEAILTISPETIVYVSCNPSTMSRDIKPLLEEGYIIKEVTPVDMFPHTAHVESIVLLESDKI